jgi:hypothetical protein
MGRFTELKNSAMFSSVVCIMGSIQWQNGLDLCPDTLYEESEPYTKIKVKEHRAQSTGRRAGRK